MLALQVVFLFVAIPALTTGEAERSLDTLLQLALAGIAIGLIARSLFVRIGLAASFGATLLVRLLPGIVPEMTTLIMVFAYNVLLTAVMARAVFGPGEVNHHRIAGAIFIYLNVAVLFALAFSGLMRIVPHALSGFQPDVRHHAADMIHYSFTTLTAIGDNRLTPNCAAARSLADLETIIGHLFPAILLSRLVGLHLSKDVRA